MAAVLQDILKLKIIFMKKIMLIVILFITSKTFAQNYELGAKGGVNISNFTGATWDNASAKSLIGFHAGGFLSLFLGNNFAIQPEVLFSSQGAKYQDATSSQNLKVNYINIPVMLKYRFNNGYFIEAGPQIGFRQSELSSFGTVNGHVKSTDFSVAGGIGYQSSIGLGVGARYTAGVSKVGDFEPSNGINPDFKNGVLQLSLFYTIFGGKKK